MSLLLANSTLLITGTAAAAAAWGDDHDGQMIGVGDNDGVVREKQQQELEHIFFFDDHRLNLRTANMRRTVGTPQLLSTYHDPNSNRTKGAVGLTFAGPSAFRVPSSSGDGDFRLVYQSYYNGPFCCLLARSADGHSWVAEDTTRSLPTLPNRQFPNQIMPAASAQGLALSSVYVDEQAPATHRLKAILSKNGHPLSTQRAAIFISSDGLHWAEMVVKNTSATWLEPPLYVPEPPNFAFWNHVSNAVGLSTRPMWGDRRISYHETVDWTKNTTFTPELIFEPNEFYDGPLAEHYGHFVVPLAGKCSGFIGMLFVYHVPPGFGVAKDGYPGVGGVCPDAFNGGKIDVQLTFSRNGKNWMRTMREPLLPVAPVAGNFPVDGGVVFPSSTLTTHNGNNSERILIIASASRREHGHMAEDFPMDSAILTYSLRRDGWVSLTAEAGYGYIGTRVLYWRTPHTLEMNIDARFGRARARLTNSSGYPLEGFDYHDCFPFSGDDTAWRPYWGKRNVTHVVYRVELELLNARVWSIRGDFIVMQTVQVNEFATDGTVPVYRPGF